MKLHSPRTTQALWVRLAPLARQMRHEPTPAEIRLWGQLRNRKLAGAKFRRQYVIERFILDFYAARESLVVEVDGGYHQYTATEDAIRQTFLESMGLKVLRVKNEDVMDNLEGVLAWIATAIAERRQRQAIK